MGGRERRGNEGAEDRKDGGGAGWIQEGTPNTNRIHRTPSESDTGGVGRDMQAYGLSAGELSLFVRELVHAGRERVQRGGTHKHTVVYGVCGLMTERHPSRTDLNEGTNGCQ